MLIQNLVMRWSGSSVFQSFGKKQLKARSHGFLGILLRELCCFRDLAGSSKKGLGISSKHHEKQLRAYRAAVCRFRLRVLASDLGLKAGLRYYSCTQDLCSGIAVPDNTHSSSSVGKFSR